MTRDTFIRAFAYTMLLFGVISMPVGALQLPLAPDPIDWGEPALWIALAVRTMVVFAGLMLTRRLVAIKFNLGYIVDSLILASAVLVYVYYGDTQFVLPLVLIGAGAVADAVSLFRSATQNM